MKFSDHKFDRLDKMFAQKPMSQFKQFDARIANGYNNFFVGENYHPKKRAAKGATIVCAHVKPVIFQWIKYLVTCEQK